MSSPITRRRIGGHTGSCLCYVQGRLSAARVVSGMKNYDHGLTHLLHSELHWLEPRCGRSSHIYKLGVTVYKCLHGQAPDYLSELCTPVAQVAERQHLHSASRHLLVVRYDSVYLTCSKKLTGSQLSLPHGINKKLKFETKNKMMSVIGLVQSLYREAVQ